MSGSADYFRLILGLSGSADYFGLILDLSGSADYFGLILDLSGSADYFGLILDLSGSADYFGLILGLSGSVNYFGLRWQFIIQQTWNTGFSTHLRWSFKNQFSSLRACVCVCAGCQLFKSLGDLAMTPCYRRKAA